MAELFQSKQELIDFLDQVIKNKQEFLSYQTKRESRARQEGMIKALEEIRVLITKKVPTWRPKVPSESSTQSSSQGSEKPSEEIRKSKRRTP